MPIEAMLTDVTRMHAPNVCIAAIVNDKPIRLDSPRPNDNWIQSIGGLAPGDVVSVDWKPTKGATPPHTEDGEWDSSSLKKLRHLTDSELTAILSASAFDSVQDAFGAPAIRGTGGNAAFSPGKGRRSLASILAQSVRAYPDFKGIKVDFTDSKDSWTSVPLEDLVIRKHQKQCRTCSSRLSTLLTNEFQGTNAILRVGLARQFQAGGHPSACWMQLNHIFLIPPKRKHFV